MPGPKHIVITKAQVHSCESTPEMRRCRPPTSNSENEDLDRFAGNGPLSLADSNSLGPVMSIKGGADLSDQKSHPVENGPTSGLDKTESKETVVNGDFNIDEIVNIKKLEEQELYVRVAALVNILKSLESYETGHALRLIKAIGDTYWTYRPLRTKTGDAAADAGLAEIAMKMLKSHNVKGIFKNDEIWFPVYYTLNVLWNFTDASSKLAKSVAEADGVRFFTANCSHKPYLENLQNKNVYYVVKSSMSIVNNISRCSDVIHFFKENKTQEVMLTFLKGHEDQEMLKIMAMLTLSHIVEEEDNEKLIDDTGAIKSIIKYIDSALRNERKRHRGFTPHELMEGLTNLGVNDVNKQKIVDSGAIPVFMKLLESESIEEQAVAAKAVWTLSFDKGVCTALKEYEGLMAILEKLSASEDSDVRKQSNGALFVLRGDNDVTNRPKSGRKNRGHVFLSYSWSEKDMVLKLRDKLKADGHEVWIDVERMGGSTLSAMADAVENAAIVLICMSEKYKQSPNCRLEAEYTFQLRKDYIPLMLQRKYRPDGWLGAILGAKLFFDFSGKYPFDKSWTGLVKELKGLGKFSALTPKKDDVDGPIADETAIMTSSARTTSPFSPSASVMKMTQDDVRTWLCDIKLDGCVPSMAQFDGPLLGQLQKMREEAPEFYYHCLEKKLNFNIVEILTFNKALEKL